MESLYLLLPMSVLLVLGLIGLFAWALHAGQFDDLEREGMRVLEADEPEQADATLAGVAPARRSQRLDSAQEAGNSPAHNVALKDQRGATHE
ncbi:MAG: cbb3-type cytochrome oxidase assembly protein CcoS [Burkholderiaceae bacterium]|nr:cbb3-type cytochrome oxidase assembly protein CcoS [Burkholderiaceae bacterium]